MIRKKRRGQVSHDRWLVSYADFITLLFAFFVVLFATGQSDKQKKVELAASIQSAFNQMGIFDSHLALLPSAQLIGSGGSAVPPIVSTPLAPTVESMVIVRQRIEETARADIASGVIAIHQSESGMVISLQEAGFFESGAADIRPSALQVLYRIAAVLPESSLRVEGHTGSCPALAQAASRVFCCSTPKSILSRCPSPVTLNFILQPAMLLWRAGHATGV
jgi:chemotaxis protein MotB